MGKFEVGQTVLVNTGHAILEGVIKTIAQHGATVSFGGGMFEQFAPLGDIFERSDLDRLEEVASREAFCKKELIAHFRGTLCAGR